MPLSQAKMMSNTTASGIIRVATVVALLIAVVFLVVMSILVQHTEFIVRRPMRFVFEALLLGVCGAAPIYYIAYSRKSSYKRATRDFILLILKFAVFWVLFELSGVNSVLFPMKRSALIKRGLLPPAPPSVAA
jgi:hypothetical protein